MKEYFYLHPGIITFTLKKTKSDLYEKNVISLVGAHPDDVPAGLL